MNTNKPILSLSIQEPIDQQMLLAYLEGKLSPEQSHIVEEWLNNSPLASEAIDGLINIEDKKQLYVVLKELNQSIQSKIRRKHKRNIKAYSKSLYWFAIGLIVILLLCSITLFIIHMLHNK